MATTDASAPAAPAPGRAAPSQGQRIQSCVSCQARKVKCDKREPCFACTKARVECVFAASFPRRRKKRFPEAELLARLRRYEDALRGYGANLDEINGGDAGKRTQPARSTSDGMAALTFQEPSHASEAVKPSDFPVAEDEERGHVDERLPKREDSPSWTTVGSAKFRQLEELLQGSSEDEMDEAPLKTTFDWLSAGDGSGFPFGAQPTATKLTSLHPQPVHIFRLWQTFLDNVNPLMKVVHAPTLQQQFLHAIEDLDNISKEMEALIFGIYAFAVFSLDDAQCQTAFGEEKRSLLAKYQFGARQALLNAEFLRTSDIMVVQALLFYLHSIKITIDPRSLYCMIGNAVRIAQRMGLHVDGAGRGLPAFEVEMRRRLWWQIILYDIRIGEMSGAPVSVLDQPSNVRPPLNVNDSDLSPDAVETPVEHGRPTEMAFCLVRCQVVNCIRQIQSCQEPSGFGTPLTSSSKAIDDLEQAFESQLRGFDPMVPLHAFSTTAAKMAICKLKLTIHHPRTLQSHGAHLSQPHKDMLFSICSKSIHLFNSLLSNPSTHRFLWYTYSNYVLDAEIFLLNELRYRPTGDLSDKAWEQISIANEERAKRHDAARKESPLHLAIARLAVKAWEARENALRFTSPAVSTPPFITELRSRLATKRSQHSSPRSDDAITTPNYGTSGDHVVGGYQQDVSSGPMKAGNDLDSLLFANGEPMQDAVDWGYWTDLMRGYATQDMNMGG